MRTARRRDGETAGARASAGYRQAGGRPDSQARRPAVPPSALERLVAIERHKAESGFAPDPLRLAAGWDYRFVADAARAEESATVYRELGFEVALEPVGEAASPECRDCRLVAVLRFRAIYTRRSQE